VRGLVINNFRVGVDVEGAHAVLEDNYIGTDVTGTLARGNYDGVSVSSYYATIGSDTGLGRNLISGNVHDRVVIRGAWNEVLGNYIGTDVTGTKALGNGVNGIEVIGHDNTIGTAAVQDGAVTIPQGNVISGNAYGVHLGFDSTLPTSGNRVQGNYIGT